MRPPPPPGMGMRLGMLGSQAQILCSAKYERSWGAADDPWAVVMF